MTNPCDGECNRSRVLALTAGLTVYLCGAASADITFTMKDCLGRCDRWYTPNSTQWSKCRSLCTDAWKHDYAWPDLWNISPISYNPGSTGYTVIEDGPRIDWSAGGPANIGVQVGKTPFGLPIGRIDFRLGTREFDQLEPYGVLLGSVDVGGATDGEFWLDLDTTPYQHTFGTIMAEIHYTPGGEGTWDQSEFDLKLPALADQDFTDFPDFSTYAVDDFSTEEQTWNVHTIHTYYTKKFGAWNQTIQQGRLQVFAKTGETPTDDDHAPEYTVPITLIDGGNHWEAVADTSGIEELQGIKGAFWIGLTPIADYGTYGQEYRITVGKDSRDRNGTGTMRNPGGALGIGTGWVPINTIYPKAKTFAYRLDFELVSATPVQDVVPIAMVGDVPGQECYADFNLDGTLDLFDFLGFVNTFNAGEPKADCTADGMNDLFDFLCFVNAFNAGC